ncbi:hypothetical protein B0H11DRAFT_1902140 [Mycena galericulata]|nr:hypothetical protein B0H11DRAFT_1902140 [Mycena galericulata]
MVSTNIRCFAAQRGRQQRELAENKNDYTPTGWTIFYLELNFKPCAGELKKEKNSTEALDRGIEAGYSELMLSLTIEFHPSKIEYRVMYTTVHYVPGREEPTRGVLHGRMPGEVPKRQHGTRSHDHSADILSTPRRLNSNS